MSHTIVRTDRAPAAIGPYSQAIIVGPWLFISGQIPLKPETGELVKEGFAGQTRQALENLTAILDSAAYGPADVVSVDVFITDLSHFTVFNEIYEGFFGSHRPARAVVEVKGLPRGASIEIKCIAFRNA